MPIGRHTTAHTTAARQYVSHEINAQGLRTISDDELCRRYPPPEWMQKNARKMWCDCIRSYFPGQFKRGNMPMLEQYILLVMSIRKLTRRIGYTSGLVRQSAEIDDDGAVEMVSKITHEHRLYRSMLAMLSRVHADLHLVPRPYVFAGRGEVDDGTEDMHDDAETTAGQGARLDLIGGRKEAKVA